MVPERRRAAALRWRAAGVAPWPRHRCRSQNRQRRLSSRRRRTVASLTDADRFELTSAAERFWPFQQPSRGDAQRGAILVDVQRYRSRGRSRSPTVIDDELPRRRRDESVQRATFERQLVVALAGIDEPDARVGVDRRLADGADVEARARGRVGHERLSNPEAAGPGKQRGPDARLSGHARHLPRARSARRLPGEADHRGDLDQLAVGMKCRRVAPVQ